jgi:hypothetical protein
MARRLWEDLFLNTFCRRIENSDSSTTSNSEAKVGGESNKKPLSLFFAGGLKEMVGDKYELFFNFVTNHCRQLMG